MFSFAKTLRTVMTLWRRYDVRKYTADVILFREIQCKKMDNLMFKQRFQCELSWNKVKYARITITHVYFIALTLAGSLGRCLKTGPVGLMFKQHPWDPANVNAWKNMCDPYILAWAFVTRSCLKSQNPCSNHEIHVLFEHGFHLKKPKLGTDLYGWRYTRKRCGRDWPFRRCFRSRKRCARILTFWRRNDVQKFDADAILFREIKRKRRDI